MENMLVDEMTFPKLKTDNVEDFSRKFDALTNPIDDTFNQRRCKWKSVCCSTLNEPNPKCEGGMEWMMFVSRKLAAQRVS
ncbi:hypothetical protein M8J77_010748 [Diaphorina citri]|nr:hypothetical protein M8J77_010748 [Diaphorina citri]